MSDPRTDQRLLYVEATLDEIAELATRGRAAFDTDLSRSGLSVQRDSARDRWDRSTDT